MGPEPAPALDPATSLWDVTETKPPSTT